MPKIERPKRVSFRYTNAEIVHLIINDLLLNHGLEAKPTDIHVDYSGGTMYDAAAGYSGGGGPDWKCDPVTFNGYSGAAEVTVPGIVSGEQHVHEWHHETRWKGLAKNLSVMRCAACGLEKPLEEEGKSDGFPYS